MLDVFETNQPIRMIQVSGCGGCETLSLRFCPMDVVCPTTNILVLSCMTSPSSPPSSPSPTKKEKHLSSKKNTNFRLHLFRKGFSIYIGIFSQKCQKINWLPFPSLIYCHARILHQKNTTEHGRAGNRKT